MHSLRLFHFSYYYYFLLCCIELHLTAIQIMLLYPVLIFYSFLFLFYSVDTLNLKVGQLLTENVTFNFDHVNVGVIIYNILVKWSTTSGWTLLLLRSLEDPGGPFTMAEGESGKQKYRSKDCLFFSFYPIWGRLIQHDG